LLDLPWDWSWIVLGGRLDAPKPVFTLEMGCAGFYIAVLIGGSVCIQISREGGERLLMIKVRARDREPVEQLLKRFKKLCEKEGLTKDIKRSSYYEKPSERRRRKIRKAERKAQQSVKK